MKDEPCFTCTLPDCDIASPECGLRKLRRSCERKMKGRESAPITPKERDAYNEVFLHWHLERMAQASEGVRPYKRLGSPWKPGEPAPQEARP